MKLINDIFSPIFLRIGFTERQNLPKLIFKISQVNASYWLCNENPEFLEVHSSNLWTARTQLIRILEREHQLPDIIIIDTPFSKRHVQNFTEWINDSPVFCKIPVVYNIANLSVSEIEEIRKMLVDDILDINKNIHLLSTKCTFLQKVKLRQLKQKNKYIQTSIETFTLFAATYNLFRRILDIIVAASLIVLLLPLFLIVSIVIRLESRGPIFYISKRAGRGYKVFNFYKFRTMVADADKQVKSLVKENQYGSKDKGPHFFKVKNDPRVTKLGSFLRNTSIDELPQLFNVLKGDMSIVGNRPLPLYEAVTLTTNEWAERFMAPAGITGLWQIKKRGKGDMSVEERINLDITYAKHNDIISDLWILAQTSTALFQKTNV